jgi:ubiquinone/menaquinone biosynthesis C-methylase UbiE
VASRAPTGLIPPSWLSAGLRARSRRTRPAPFAWFELDDGRQLPLDPGCRDAVKSRWRSYWWATRALAALEAAGELSIEAQELMAALASELTLPAPVLDFAAQAALHAERLPDVVRPTGRMDERLGVPVLAAVPGDERIEQVARVYEQGAGQVAAALRGLGLEPSAARILEVGCGRGYTASALAGGGAGEVVGIDLDPAGQVSPAEIAAVRARLGSGRAALIEEGDVRRLPYPDGAFDAAFSVAVLEHVDDVAGALRELHRVTRPGGLGHHGIDIWFGIAGGHSLCTLDAPWGHVRLTEQELKRYLRERRPHEAGDAIEMLEHAFQRPRVTIRETAALARAAGFEVVSASLLRLSLRDPRRAWFSSDVLRECRRVYPAVGSRDLLSVSATLVLRRR